MAKSKVTEAEVRFARSFLKALKGNESNGYLLLAVIAWMRSESGQRYIGNNPFNLRPGNDIAQWQIGIRKGPVGYFAVFKNLEAGAAATAARLMKAGFDYRGYGPAVAAARRGTGSDKGIQQAIDFLTAIAMSKWSSSHYGAADGNVVNNKLIKVWAGLTGTPIPKEWFKDTTKPPPPPKPKPPPFRQPRSLYHTIPRPDYLSPYGARSFYDARPHQGDFILPREGA